MLPTAAAADCVSDAVFILIASKCINSPLVGVPR